jgi:fructose-1,6-bisphosphatase
VDKGDYQMTKLLLKGGLCLAAFAIGLSQPASAAMTCWDQNHSAAAKIRDLQSRLMVATMRCRAFGIDVLPEYNEFVRVNRSTIQDANGLIKAQFRAGYGEALAQRSYDSFTTSLANAYGADETSVEVCEETAELAAEAVAAQGNVDRLLHIAERVGSGPDLPGGRCPITLAASEQE